MSAVSENTILVFMEEGKDLSALLEQIFIILTNTEWESEEDVC